MDTTPNRGYSIPQAVETLFPDLRLMLMDIDADVDGIAGGGMSNPMTTLGDIIAGGGSGTPQRLAIGSSNQVLTVVSGAPAWATPTAYQPLDGDLTAIAALVGTSGLLKKTAANTWSLDTSDYIVNDAEVSIGTGDAALVLSDAGQSVDLYGATINLNAATAVNVGLSSGHVSILGSLQLPQHTSNGLLRTSGGNGTVSVDTTPYLSSTAVDLAFTASQSITVNDAATNTFTDLLSLKHNSTGTPAANFGGSIKFLLESSTTADQDAARIGVVWTTATHGSRSSAVVIQTVTGAGALAEVAMLTGNGLSTSNLELSGDAEVTGEVSAGSLVSPSLDSSGAIAIGHAGANVSMAGSFSVDGTSLFNDAVEVSADLNVSAGDFSTRGIANFGTAGTAKGVLNLAGNTSGVVTIQPAAAAGTWTLTLPTNDGSAGQFLQTDGNGVTTWASPAGSGDALTTQPLSQFAATTSSQLASVLSDESGSSGGFVRAVGASLSQLVGLAIRSTGAAFDLTIATSEVLTAGRTLSIVVNDAARTLTISGNATISGTHSGTSSGTNTGDQTSVSGNAGTSTALATARAIYGNNFDGTAALTQIIASTYGGTGNGFTKFTGPASTEKTFTLPNANATLARTDAAQTFTGDQTFSGLIKAGSGPTTLTDAAGKILSAALNTVGVGQGGTGTATAFTAGSIVFAGASGVYSQDNSNLFWDDTNNKLGIGTSDPTNGGTENYSRFTCVANDATAMVNSMAINTGAGQTGIVIKRTGTTPSRWYNYIPTGSTDLRWYNGADYLTLSAAGALRFHAYGAGTLVTDASGNVTASSDARLKDSTGNFELGIESLLALPKAQTFRWKKDNAKGMESAGEYVSWMAQDVLPIIPLAVGIDAAGFYSLSDRPILAATVNSVVDHEKRIIELQTRVRELESQLERRN